MQERGKTGDPRENPDAVPTCENPGATPPGNRSRFALVRGELSNHCNTAAPSRLSYLHAAPREHCTSVQRPACRGDGALVARADVALIAPALLRKGEKQSRQASPVYDTGLFRAPLAPDVSGRHEHVGGVQDDCLPTSSPCIGYSRVVGVRAETIDRSIDRSFRSAAAALLGVVVAGIVAYTATLGAVILSAHLQHGHAMPPGYNMLITASHIDQYRRTRVASVAERLARPPPTRANRAQCPAESPDFLKWESCRTMPLVGGASRGSPVFPAPSFRCRSIFTSITLIGSQDLVVKSRPNLFTQISSRLVNRVQSSACSFPDFRKWESCKTTPLVAGFSRGSPVSPVIVFRLCPYSHRIPSSSALKNSLTNRKIVSGNTGTNTTKIAVVENIGSSLQPCLQCLSICATLKVLRATEISQLDSRILGKCYPSLGRPHLPLNVTGSVGSSVLGIRQFVEHSDEREMWLAIRRRALRPRS
ncbi:hypothetical protein PR048_031082 [Dryococelus australis]|uniref:Uncharacterized protein n=1 Tax=Dryococelus australis TaxID=614101 RepID=A0ABQ9G7E4_9NEOP|nr:hypothetical protein PR048_031082 [Dryococelus australis]